MGRMGRVRRRSQSLLSTVRGSGLVWWGGWCGWLGGGGEEVGVGAWCGGLARLVSGWVECGWSPVSVSCDG